MTGQNNPETADETPRDAPETAESNQTGQEDTGQRNEPQEDAGQQDEPQEARGNREAAKYRKQLREVEAERDALRQQLDAARHHIAHAALSAAVIRPIEGRQWETRQIQPNAIEKAEINVSELFDEDGQLNPAKVESTLTALHKSDAWMFTKPKSGNVAPREGLTTRTGGKTNDWSSAFSPRRD